MKHDARPHADDCVKTVLDAYVIAATGPMRDVSVVGRGVYLCVAWCPGMTMTACAQLIDRDQATVSKACRQLEDIGLILIKPDPQSRRQKNLYLTAQGKRRREDLVNTVSAAIKRAWTRQMSERD